MLRSDAAPAYLVDIGFDAIGKLCRNSSQKLFSISFADWHSTTDTCYRSVNGWPCSRLNTLQTRACSSIDAYRTLALLRY